MDIVNVIVTTKDYSKFASYVSTLNTYISHCLNTNNVSSALATLNNEKSKLKKVSVNDMATLVIVYLESMYNFIDKNYN